MLCRAGRQHGGGLLTFDIVSILRWPGMGMWNQAQPMSSTTEQTLLNQAALLLGTGINRDRPAVAGSFERCARRRTEITSSAAASRPVKAVARKKSAAMSSFMLAPASAIWSGRCLHIHSVLLQQFVL